MAPRGVSSCVRGTRTRRRIPRRGHPPIGGGPIYELFACRGRRPAAKIRGPFLTREDRIMAIEPLAVGVCSWSLQVTSVPELKGFLDRLGIDVVQIACGDPHHASWDEGDAYAGGGEAAGFRMSGAMLGFPGEDYTTPQTIEKTGGFGDPATRPERLERFKWGLQRTPDLGLSDLMLHAGFIPEVGDAGPEAVPRHAGDGGGPGAAAGVTVAFETGQESARCCVGRWTT